MATSIRLPEQCVHHQTVLGVSYAESLQFCAQSLPSTAQLMRLNSSFWHQINRQRFSSPASWLAYTFLKLERGGFVGRYLFCFLVFLTSGVVHGITDLAQGMSWNKSGSLQFFVTQFCGVFLEDMFQHFWLITGANTQGKFTKLVGFAWVLLFHVWSVPGWIYPSLVDNVGGEKDAIVPFSVVKFLLRSEG